MNLPFRFKMLQGNHFYNEDSYSYGAVELTSFSGVGVTQEGPDRQYAARLFYLSRRIYMYEIHLAVTWDTKAHLTV